MFKGLVQKKKTEEGKKKIIDIKQLWMMAHVQPYRVGDVKTFQIPPVFNGWMAPQNDTGAIYMLVRTEHAPLCFLKLYLLNVIYNNTSYYTWNLQ